MFGRMRFVERREIHVPDGRQRDFLHTPQVFPIPGRLVAAGKFIPEINAHGKRLWLGVTCAFQLGISGPIAGQYEHHCPVTVAKHTGKGFMIDATRLRRISRMCVDPDASKLLGMPTSVDLIVKVIGNCRIVESDGDFGAGLADQDDVLDEPGLPGIGNPEPTNFGGSAVTQVNQLGPGIWAEFQQATFPALGTLPTRTMQQTMG